MTNSHSIRILCGGLLAVLLVAAFSGCGEDDDSESSGGTTTSSTTTTGASSSLEGWAQGFCTAVASWQTSTKETTAEVASSQADFANASEAITSANEALVGSLEGLGTPPAPATTQAQDAIDELSAELEEGSGEIEQALFGVSTESEIAKATARVRTLLSKMEGDISRTVAELQALPDEQGWKQAFQQVATCRTVAGG